MKDNDTKKLETLYENIHVKVYTKKEAKYTEGKGKWRCKNCSYFKKPNKCMIVIDNSAEGINPEGLCIFFEKNPSIYGFNKNDGKVTPPETPSHNPVNSKSPAEVSGGQTLGDPVIGQPDRG